MEERAQGLAKTGKTASAGNTWRFLGHLVYNSEDLLRAREIAREIAANKRKEREDTQEERDMALLDKAEQAYRKFKEMGSLLDRLTVPDLQDIVRFLCSVEKKGAEDTFTRNNKGKKNLKERIAAVEPGLWTKYFDQTLADEEEEAESEEDGLDNEGLQPINENDNEMSTGTSC